MLPHAECEIAHFIYNLRPYATKVFYAREYYMNQLIKEGLLTRAS